MPKTSIESTIRKGLAKLHYLRAERDAINESIATLESILGKVAAAPVTLPRQRARHRSPGRRKGERRQFDQTASEFIIGLLGSREKLETSAINAEWKQAGRAGTANVTLGQLVKAKKIKRRKIRGHKGSRYTVA